MVLRRVPEGTGAPLCEAWSARLSGGDEAAGRQRGKRRSAGLELPYFPWEILRVFLRFGWDN